MVKATLFIVLGLIVLGSAGSIIDNAKRQRNCEGRLEMIGLPSRIGIELSAIGEKRRNLRADAKQSYLAKSYGNCCWIVYSRWTIMLCFSIQILILKSLGNIFVEAWRSSRDLTNTKKSTSLLNHSKLWTIVDTKITNKVRFWARRI